LVALVAVATILTSMAVGLVVGAVSVPLLDVVEVCSSDWG